MTDNTSLKPDEPLSRLLNPPSKKLNYSSLKEKERMMQETQKCKVMTGLGPAPTTNSLCQESY